MKKLLALLLLFGIVGCEKESKEVVVEPSLLDKCVSSNLTALQDLSIENEVIDSLQLYIPEGAYHIMGSIQTKEEFSKFLSIALDADKAASWNEQMCAEINPKIKQSPKDSCLILAEDMAQMSKEDKEYPELWTVEYWSDAFKCDEDDDFVEQEPLVIEGCLEMPEQELFEIFINFSKDEMDERFNKVKDEMNLGFFRKELIKQGIVMDDGDREFFNETYKHYSEIFNREAVLICNTQGIY